MFGYMPTKQYFDRTNHCQNPRYTVRILSYDPLLLHIEGFISSREREYLKRLAYVILPSLRNGLKDSVKMQETKRGPMFKQSLVDDAEGQPRRSNNRTSSTAILPANDAVVRCIAERASEFQGFVPLHNINLQATRYTEGQEYKPHWDWGGHNRHRDTTFFGIIDVSCETCGTHFPALGVDWVHEDQRWCSFVNCDNLQSLTVRPVPGSALFWRNLHSNGTGDIRTLHAGLPARGGIKIGLNIWTRTQAPLGPG